MELIDERLEDILEAALVTKVVLSLLDAFGPVEVVSVHGLCLQETVEGWL